MARYIDADIVIQEIEKLQTELESNNDTIWKKNKQIYKGLCYARGIIDDTPTADVLDKSECDKLKNAVDGFYSEWQEFKRALHDAGLPTTKEN